MINQTIVADINYDKVFSKNILFLLYFEQFRNNYTIYTVKTKLKILSQFLPNIFQ